MRFIFITAALALVAPNLATAQTPAPAKPVTAGTVPAAAPGAYSVTDTDLGTLLDDPKAKAVLSKHLPELTNNEQINMARGMTLKAVQSYSADQVTDAKLAAVQADLNAIKK